MVIDEENNLFIVDRIKVKLFICTIMNNTVLVKRVRYFAFSYSLTPAMN